MKMKMKMKMLHPVTESDDPQDSLDSSLTRREKKRREYNDTWVRFLFDWPVLGVA